MSSPNAVVKMPINKPTHSKRRLRSKNTQTSTAVPAQHIALRTTNIINAITNLKAQGVEFIKVPKTYYNAITLQLKPADMKLDEDFEVLKSLKILIDFDEGGYLLQLSPSI
jgi:4-hydroxyphenylpyruvate dioxygenase